MVSNSTSNRCGNDVIYELIKDDNTLKIDGSGAMYDYSRHNPPPWIQYAADIRKIIITGGVTRIGNFAFAYLKKLKSIILDKSVKIVGEYSFYRCKSIDSGSCSWDGLELIETCGFYKANSINFTSIPPNIKEIGPLGLSCLKSLKRVILSDGIKRINEFAFGGCDSLIEISFPSSVIITGGFLMGAHNLKVENITINGSDKGPYVLDKVEKILYNRVTGELLGYFDFDASEYTIPGYIKSIGSGAFYRCYNLRKIVIPDGIIKIGNKAFGQMRSLSCIIVPASVKEYGEQLFINENTEYSVLETVIFRGNVKTIDKKMFLNASKLRNIVIMGSVDKIEESAFDTCNSLGLLFIGNNQTGSLLHIKKQKGDKMAEITNLFNE